MTASVTPDEAQRPRSPAVLAAVVALVVTGVAADQATKAWAESSLGDGSTIDLLPTLRFNLHYNNGFSFGTGQGAGSFIGVVVIAMSLYLVHLIRNERTTSRSLILAAILSGAIGNLLDRIFRADDGPLSGDVVDFIDVTWFAIFNVADILVVGGVILFLLNELFQAARGNQGGSDHDDAVEDHQGDDELSAELAEPAQSAESAEPAESDGEGGPDGSEDGNESSLPLSR